MKSPFKMASNITVEPSYSELGAQPTYGPLMVEYVPELAHRWLRCRVYDKMLNDAQVRAALRATKIPVLGAEWSFDPASNNAVDQQAAEFVDWAFHNMTISFNNVLDESLTCQDFGYAGLEKVFTSKIWTPSGKSQKPRRVVTWKKLAPRPLHTIQDFIYDKNGGPVSIKQAVLINNEGRIEQSNVEIPIDRMVVFTYDKRGGDLEGRSLLRSAYQHWYFKQKLYTIDAIQKERHGLGVPKVTLPAGAPDSERQKALQMVQNIRTNQNSGIVIPNGWVVEFAQVFGNLVDALASAQEHDMMIARNVLVQFINATSGNTGSKGATATQADLFMKSLVQTSNLIAETFQLYAIKQLVDLNFKVDDYPCMKARHLGESKDFQQLASALNNLESAGILTADLPTENWVREELRMPAKTEDRPPEADLPSGHSAGRPGEAGNTPNSAIGTDNNG